jgi:hypothetical protein
MYFDSVDARENLNKMTGIETEDIKENAMYIVKTIFDWTDIKAGTPVNIPNGEFFKYVPCYRKPICIKDKITGELSYYRKDEIIFLEIV